MDPDPQSSTLEKIKREITALFDENARLKNQVNDLRVANLALSKALAEVLGKLNPKGTSQP